MPPKSVVGKTCKGNEDDDDEDVINEEDDNEYDVNEDDDEDEYD
jgi:hypothetical protein